MEALQGLHLADTWRSSRMSHRGKHRSAETIHSYVGAMPSTTHPKQATLVERIAEGVDLVPQWKLSPNDWHKCPSDQNN